MMPAEQPAEDTKPQRLDAIDASYYVGLILLGIGLTFAFSWQMALIVIGAVLVLVSVAGAFAVLILSARIDAPQPKRGK